jgi:hypothetical protein
MQIEFGNMYFNIGWVRYEGLFNGNYIIVAGDTWGYDVRRLVDDLQGGDNDAMEAATILKALEEDEDIWIESHDDPSIAMYNLCLKLNAMMKEMKK